MNPKVPAQSFLAARLRGWKAPSSIEVEHLPFIEVTVTERERTGDFGAPGKKTVVFNLAYTPRNLTGSMEACSVEVFVTKDPEDKSATMALSDFQIQRQHAKDL